METSAPATVLSLGRLLRERAAAGVDVAALWRRGRWLLVNRAVSHVADLPIGMPLEGAPADLNSKPWRVRLWSLLDEQDREDVLDTVTSCYCDPAAGLVPCDFCRGTRKAPRVELADGDAVQWTLRGAVDSRFRVHVTGTGALMRVSLRPLTVGTPDLFATPPPLKASLRFGMALVNVAGRPQLVIKRAGNVATLHPLHGEAPSGAPRSPERPRRSRDGYDRLLND